MPYIPGKDDQLFEAVKDVFGGNTPEGQYARNALGFDPKLEESIRVMEISPEARSGVMERLSARDGMQAAQGFNYGQVVYYEGAPYRLEAVQGRSPDYGSQSLKLTLVNSDLTMRLTGVNANTVTIPTPTTANMGEDIELLGEGRTPIQNKRRIEMWAENMRRQLTGIEKAVGRADLDKSAGAIATISDSLDKAFVQVNSAASYVNRLREK